MQAFWGISGYFGTLLTLMVFLFGLYLNKKFPGPLTTPLFIGTILVIAILVMFNIPYSVYNSSAKYLTWFLVPVTVCFAVPMYKQLPLLRKHGPEILISILFGVVGSVCSVVLVCALFGLGDIFVRSLAAISVTTAIAIGITNGLGGVVALTVAAVVITGVLGASIGDIVCRVFLIKNPIARGLAIGNASHAAGTVKAMEMGQVEGAMSSLAIVLSGILTAIVAPIIISLIY